MITHRVHYVWREGMSDYAEYVNQRDTLRPDGGR